MFETVRWGLPNLAVIITLATIPLASLATRDQPNGWSTRLETVELNTSLLTEETIAVD